jgi:hypothetical protein
MADQCAIRSGREASKRQISSVLWNLPGDRPEQWVGRPEPIWQASQSGQRIDLLQGLGGRSDGCAIDARPRQTKQ